MIASFIVSKRFGGWKIALCMAAGIQLFSMQMYILFASSEKQRWANPELNLVEMEDIDHESSLCPRDLKDNESELEFVNHTDCL